jgi:hypothetical protein
MLSDMWGFPMSMMVPTSKSFKKFSTMKTLGCNKTTPSCSDMRSLDWQSSVVPPHVLRIAMCSCALHDYPSMVELYLHIWSKSNINQIISSHPSSYPSEPIPHGLLPDVQRLGELKASRLVVHLLVRCFKRTSWYDADRSRKPPGHIAGELWGMRAATDSTLPTLWAAALERVALLAMEPVWVSSRISCRYTFHSELLSKEQSSRPICIAHVFLQARALQIDVTLRIGRHFLESFYKLGFTINKKWTFTEMWNCKTWYTMGGLRKYPNAYLPKPKYLGWVDPF